VKRTYLRSFAFAVQRRIGKVREFAHSRALFSTSQAVDRIQKRPGLLAYWLGFIDLFKYGVSDRVCEQMPSHNLSRIGGDVYFQEELETRMAGDLCESSKHLNCGSSVQVCFDIAAKIISLNGVAQRRVDHADADTCRYALPCFPRKGKEVLGSIIKDLDRREKLELALVHVRNFGEKRGSCLFRYCVANGSSLAMFDSCSQPLIYSLGSMIYSGSSAFLAYIHEIARVLSPGGSEFLGHSKYGAVAPNSDWANNPGSGSDITAERMCGFAEEAGLDVPFHRLSGIADGWRLEDLNAFSVLRRRALS
jgi:hypothetical protein